MRPGWLTSRSSVCSYSQRALYQRCEGRGQERLHSRGVIGFEPAMTTEHQIFIDVPDGEQYEELQRIKQRHGLTWRGLLLQGANRIDEL